MVLVSLLSGVVGAAIALRVSRGRMQLERAAIRSVALEARDLQREARRIRREAEDAVYGCEGAIRSMATEREANVQWIAAVAREHGVRPPAGA